MANMEMEINKAVNRNRGRLGSFMRATEQNKDMHSLQDATIRDAWSYRRLDLVKYK